MRIPHYLSTTNYLGSLTYQTYLPAWPICLIYVLHYLLTFVNNIELTYLPTSKIP